MRSLAIVLAVALTFAAPCLAQDVPENARQVAWGKGWVCNVAYVEREDQLRCVHIHIATASEVRQFMIGQSLSSYSGSCPCPYNVDRAGRCCGGRSAYSRPGGASHLCYEPDISDDAVNRTRDRYPPPGGTALET